MLFADLDIVAVTTARDYCWVCQVEQLAGPRV
jgi:hypothetical protein